MMRKSIFKFHSLLSQTLNMHAHFGNVKRRDESSVNYFETECKPHDSVSWLEIEYSLHFVAILYESVYFCPVNLNTHASGSYEIHRFTSNIEKSPCLFIYILPFYPERNRVRVFIIFEIFVKFIYYLDAVVSRTVMKFNFI